MGLFKYWGLAIVPSVWISFFVGLAAVRWPSSGNLASVAFSASISFSLDGVDTSSAALLDSYGFCHCIMLNTVSSSTICSLRCSSVLQHLVTSGLKDASVTSGSAALMDVKAVKQFENEIENERIIRQKKTRCS